jgi:dCMP deaminase
MSHSSTWDLRFLDLAKFISSWSKDPSTQTGAVIVDTDNRIVSVGFNGLPKGIPDLDEYLGNRDIKYKMVVHSEANALMFANQPSLLGCTIYNWPFMPCSSCAALIIQRGIRRVVAPTSDNPRWIENFLLSRSMFDMSGVNVLLVDYDGADTQL